MSHTFGVSRKQAGKLHVKMRRHSFCTQRKGEGAAIPFVRVPLSNVPFGAARRHVRARVGASGEGLPSGRPGQMHAVWGSPKSEA